MQVGVGAVVAMKCEPEALTRESPHRKDVAQAVFERGCRGGVGQDARDRAFSAHDRGLAADGLGIVGERATGQGADREQDGREADTMPH